jgi:cytochrome c oxidase cbb3-type subunit 3
VSEQTQNEHLTEHNYDGIQEYDNPIPGWWSWLFIGCVVFSVFYWLYYQTGVAGRTLVDQYNRASKDLLMKKFYDPATDTVIELEPTRETMVSYMSQKNWLDFGKVVFDNNCVSCHAKDGGGITGPNLTDEYWKNVKHLEDIPRVIAEGANKGAMPAWRGRLHPNEVVLVGCYVASLRGTTPANPKGREGNAIDPWDGSADVVPEETDSE